MARLQRGHIDQIAQAVDTIKNNPDSRRIMVSAWMWPTYLNASPPAVPWRWRASSLGHFMPGVVDGVVAELAWRGGRCASCLHWHRPRQPCASRGWSWCPTHIQPGSSAESGGDAQPPRRRGSRGLGDFGVALAVGLTRHGEYMPTSHTPAVGKWAVGRPIICWSWPLGCSPPRAPDYKRRARRSSGSAN